MNKKCWGCAAWALLLLAGLARAEVQIQGAGSTAAEPIYKVWAAEYQKTSGVALAYEGIGSSAGMKKIAANAVHFGASDVAPPEAELQKQGLVLFPIAISGVVPVVNLPHVRDGQVRLNGELLARIFQGEITRWDDAALAALNPGQRLPSLAITAVVRADGSGSTYNFSDYLAKLSPAWKNSMGVKTSLAWPSGFTAVKGSGAVVAAVRQTPGAIGYVDYAYVRDGKLTVAALQNAQGEFVLPGVEGFKAALAQSDWATAGRFSSGLTNQGGKGAWPITMGTYALVPQVSSTPEPTLRALKFFVWAFMNGDHLVQLSNFVRLPDRIQALAFKSISSVRDSSGQSLGAQLMGP